MRVTAPDGTVYPNIGAAAEAVGVAKNTLWNRVRKGRPPEEVFSKRPLEKGTPITVRGVTYPSVNAAAAALGVCAATVGRRLLKGWTVEQAFFPCKAVDHLGNRFKSLRAMAAHYGISLRQLLRRLDSMPLEEALTRPRHYNRSADARTDHKGREWPSVAAMCKAHGVTLSAYNERLRTLGWSKERALTTPSPRSRRTYVVDGKEYASMNDLAAAYGILPTQVTARLKIGWRLEAAVKRPIQRRRRNQPPPAKASKGDES